jgi:hypothetical protein
MTKKPNSPEGTPKGAAGRSGIQHPGMMGDGTEEQNLDERGDPAARIKKDELEAAFRDKGPKK